MRQLAIIERIYTFQHHPLVALPNTVKDWFVSVECIDILISLVIERPPYFLISVLVYSKTASRHVKKLHEVILFSLASSFAGGLYYYIRGCGENTYEACPWIFPHSRKLALCVLF